MKIVNGLRQLIYPIKGSVITVGVFDGVHTGHRKIIKKIISRSRILKLPSLVVTFYPHPLKVLDPDARVPSLISLKHRIDIIKSLGVDYIVVLKFTRSIAALEPERFVKDFLIAKFGLKEIYVGENFYFGRSGRAGVKILKKLSKRFGFKAVAVKSLRFKGKIVSSSRIRGLIMEGDLSKAARFLGRPVSILGTVVHGAKRGREIGFPTANIDPHHEAIPPSGVYAVKVKFQDRTYGGILNIGIQPTFYRDLSDREPVIEVHIFNFRKHIYGKDLEIVFIKKMRNELRFKSERGLVEQIKKDVEGVKRLYKNL